MTLGGGRNRGRRVEGARWSEQRDNTKAVITVLVVLQVVVGPGAPELGRVLLVVELQEVAPFASEAQEGGRQAAGQGHQPPGAADAREKTVTHGHGDVCVFSFLFENSSL